MKIFWLITMAAWVLATTAGHTESVYKLKDSTGATVYSDRPNLPGTTNDGTVKLAPGPSIEQQQSAERQVQQMETKSNEMKANRLDRERARSQTQEKTAVTAEEIESSDVGVVDRRRWRDPKARVPAESPDGGEHPIYQPREGRPVHAAPRPRAPAGGR
jgi:TolA-binding protein